MTLDKIFKIDIPSTAEDLIKFDFSATIDNVTLLFNFWWFNSRWNCWVTLPTGEKRSVGIFQNVLNWKEYNDYSILVYALTEVIAFEDIFNIGIYILQWQQTT